MDSIHVTYLDKSYQFDVDILKDESEIIYFFGNVQKQTSSCVVISVDIMNHQAYVQSVVFDKRCSTTNELEFETTWTISKKIIKLYPVQIKVIPRVDGGSIKKINQGLLHSIGVAKIVYSTLNKKLNNRVL